MLDETPNDELDERAATSSSVSVIVAIICNNFLLCRRRQKRRDERDDRAAESDNRAIETASDAIGQREGAMGRKGGTIQGGDRAPQQSSHANPRTRVAVEGEKTFARRFDEINAGKASARSTIFRRTFVFYLAICFFVIVI